MHHGVGVIGDALPVKCRRGNAAGTLVRGIVTGQQALTQQDFQSLNRAFTDEAARLIDQDLPHVLGVIDEDDVYAEQAVMRNVA